VSSARHENPLIVQSDHTFLVEVDSPRYVEARDALARFAELVKSPEQVLGTSPASATTTSFLLFGIEFLR
jgi:Helicase conserved C-terminal domain